MSAPASDAVRNQAIAWYSVLCSGSATAAEREDWARWRDANPEHRIAWERMEQMRATLGAAPAGLVIPILQASTRRRMVLRSLGGGVVACIAAAALWRSDTATALLAKYSTGTGERRDIELEDGSLLVLNTQSAVDTFFSPEIRGIDLLAGEILVETATSRRGGRTDPRPLVVHTPHGTITALGTRFTVRLHDDRTEVHVVAKSVRIETRGTPASTIGEGWGTSFGATGSAAPARSRGVPDAWQQGSLVVSDVALSSVVAELSRYRPGRLACDPAVALLRVSGAFPVADTDRALAVLEAALPVRAVRRTRFWVDIVAS